MAFEITSGSAQESLRMAGGLRYGVNALVHAALWTLLLSGPLSGLPVFAGEIQEADQNTPLFPEDLSPELRRQLPGARALKDNSVNVVEVRPDKILYCENDVATVRAKVIHTGRAEGFRRRYWTEPAGSLVALLHLDVDTVREVGRAPFAILPGQIKTWEFEFNVGPETYGRAIEVRFLDSKGSLIDSWQEFFSVAAEYFRVHMHTGHGEIHELYQNSPWEMYYNQIHFFGSEPTDFGVRTPDVEAHMGTQLPMPVHRAGRRAGMEYARGMGVNFSFYQNYAFASQMGFEEMRKHPEHVLYDENGQFAVDPIYVSQPNPMDLASPIEMGPKRKAKPHLDRVWKMTDYAKWYHVPANLAREETIIYAANCIKKYAEENGFTGVYVDGNMGVLKGYGYDGVLNVPSDEPEDYARLNARNHRIYSAILKKDNPNFGTWYNWSLDNIEPVIKVYGSKSWIGSGSASEVDFGDENIRAATEWKNVMLLYETGAFHENRFVPGEFLGKLIRQRDWAVQKYGANTLFGYSDTRLRADEPGPARWGWPTVNYVCAQFIATQIHFADAFMPSHRPTLQFMTRYSGLLWSPEIKVLPHEEQVVSISSPEQIWWKRLVYRRETEHGYDLIIHLVRRPPSEKFDINLAEEPVPLEGIDISVDLDGGVIRDVHAMRPYYFEEEQQPVQLVLAAKVNNGTVRVECPPFRYHMMVVFRIVE